MLAHTILRFNHAATNIREAVPSQSVYIDNAKTAKETYDVVP